MPKNIPNLRSYSPTDSDAKEVDETPMLNTTARESVDMNESNVVGKELINSEKISGPFGAIGRN